VVHRAVAAHELEAVDLGQAAKHLTSARDAGRVGAGLGDRQLGTAAREQHAVGLDAEDSSHPRRNLAPNMERRRPA
jgi:hypothetical protein